MKPKSTLRSFLLLAGSSLLAICSISATTLYWDGSTPAGDPNGGTGSWDTSTANWDTALTGGSAVTWNNATPDSAIFGGTAGTVTLGENITVGGLQFNTTAYTLSTGANTLSLSGTTNILLNNIATATISGNIGGSGNLNLSTSNPATASTLAFTGATTGGWSGTTTIGANTTITLDGAGSLNRNLLNTTGITLNGGTISSGVLANNADGSADRINDAANLTVNSGTFIWGSSNAGGTYAETTGTVTVNRGQLNFRLNGNLSSGSQALTLGALTQSGTSTVTFGNNAIALNSSIASASDVIRVNGITTSTPANQIIGPWAVVGDQSGTAFSSFARYVSDSTYGYVVADNLTDTVEGSWVNSITDAWQIQPGTSSLTATRQAAAIKIYGGSGTWTLPSFNLETYGVFFSGANAMTIAATGTGALTTPTGGGNLYVTVGQQNHAINAPINDNGGAVTLVVSGAGRTLTLGSTTSNYSGGTVLNSGILSTTADSNLGSGGGITVNGTVQWTMGAASPVTYNRSLTVNEGAVLTLSSGNAAKTVSGVLSGSGTIIGANTTGYIFTNTGNTFTGTVNNGYQMLFASLVDSSNAINLIGSNSEFQWTGGAKTFSLRPFTLQATGTGNINNAGSGALTIQQNLAITGTAGVRTLQLGGTNTGDNTFSGNIADGTDGGTSVVSVAKAGTGKWILTGTNTHTGGTTVSAGTLVIGNANALPASGFLNVAGGTLESTVGTLTSGRFIASGGTISASLGGSMGFNKFGTGTTILNSTNSFTGGITVGGGTLAVGASATLGQDVIGNSILIRDGGILTLAAAANSGSNQTITLSSSSKSGAAVSATSGSAGPTGRLAVLGLGFNGLPNGAISQANTNGGVIAINGVTGYNTDLSTLLTGKNLFLGGIGTSTFTGAAGTVVAGNDSLYRLGGGGGQITFNTTNLFTSTNGVQVGSTFLNGGGTVVISAAQDYSGTTTVSAGTLTLNGANGTATGSTGITLNGGRLFLDSSASNNSDRIGTVNVSLSNAGELSLSGNSAGTTEVFNNLSVGAGYSTVTATAVTAASTLSGNGFSRSSNGTAIFRGTALGQNTTVMGKVILSDTSGLSFVGASTLADAANGDTTKDVRIIPYLIGANTPGGTGDTFVTYDTTHGFRALNTTNHFNTTVTAGNNIRLAAAQAGITTNSINSLIIANTGSSTIADAATLTVSSGAILFSSAGTIAPAGTTGILDFGAAEGIVTTVANGVISAAISGSNGLVKSGTGQLTLSNANNTFTGGVIINAGTLVASTAASSLGGGSADVVFNGSARFQPFSGTTARGITINNGAIAELGGNGGYTFSGNVTGTGGIAASAYNFGSNVFLNGTGNTFEGPILVGLGGSGGASYQVNVASLTDSSTANGRIVLGAATTHANGTVFGYTGSTNLVLNNRQIEIVATGFSTNGQQIRSSGAGTLSIATDLIVSTPIAQTLSLGGSNTGANTFSGVIGDGDGKVSVIKTDAGTWLLNGNNTYTGLTSVNGGTLGGTGTIAGSVTVAAAGSLAPGASAGTLSIGGGLDISAPANGGAGKLKFELGANTAASDQLAVTGILTIGSGVLGFSDFTFSDLGWQNGTYTLITSGGISGTLNGANLSGSIGVGGTGTLSTSGNNIILTVTGLAGGDVTPPTLTSIADNVSGGPITEDASVTYTVTFNEDIDSATVSIADFDNQGTATCTINSVVETGANTGIFTVVATPSTPGTLRLRIPSGAVVTDTSANPLVVPVSDDTTITVRSKYEAWSGALDFDTDTNGDGVKNGLAFLLGAANKNVSALGLLPTVTQSGGNLILTFNMLNVANRKSASIQVQQSRDLGISDAWVESAVVPEVNGGPSPSVNGVTFNVTLGSPTNAVVATVAASEAGGTGKLFGRLKANQ